MTNLQFQLSTHAKIAVDERKIHVDWIARALISPQLTHPDEEDPDLLHALIIIPEYGSRVLRVVYNLHNAPP
jgi:hypothetical protein